MTDNRKVGKEPCLCPYCDAAILQTDSAHCHSCKVTIFYCPQCRKPLPRENSLCPHCGAEIKG
ncbi:zinc-ribbon domain-containing protein [Chloroflexota bacterium]